MLFHQRLPGQLQYPLQQGIGQFGEAVGHGFHRLGVKHVEQGNIEYHLVAKLAHALHLLLQIIAYPLQLQRQQVADIVLLAQYIGRHQQTIEQNRVSSQTLGKPFTGSAQPDHLPLHLWIFVEQADIDPATGQRPQYTADTIEHHHLIRCIHFRKLLQHGLHHLRHFPAGIAVQMSYLRAAPQFQQSTADFFGVVKTQCL